MIKNGNTIPSGTTLTTQVAIIGSGPAGITAAWELQKAGIKCIILEGSRPKPGGYQASWDDKVLLYNGIADGQFSAYETLFLTLPNNNPQGQQAWERERYYGGTSTHWGGQSRPLDPIAFERRPGFPGWPINRDDLDPYYSRAAKLQVLHTDNFTPEYWANLLGAEVPDLEDFNPEMYQFMGRDYLNFATRTFDGVNIADTSVEVILNATCLNIVQAGDTISHLACASMTDDATPQKATNFTVQADAYILACGAVANARQLLLSKVGNEFVGKYFMCHPLSVNPVISTNGNYQNEAQMRYMGGKTANDTQWTDKNGVACTARFIPNADVTRRMGVGRCWFWATGYRYYFEMTPNPNSRITLLSDQVDPVFKQPQTHITWELSDADEKTYTATTSLFKQNVEARGGTVSYPEWATVKQQLMVNGHHIGTTRMAEDASSGVVDANLQVFGTDNLYVAGSSVFPSTGISNPTMTIIALSIRLAEHLAKNL